MPRWATPHGEDIYSDPSTSDFGRFMEAVGKHYGSKIWMWSIWNEPNHPAFLLPQFNSNGTPASPRLILIPVVIVLAAIVAIVGSLVPLRRASQFEPALVLRGE